MQHTDTTSATLTTIPLNQLHRSPRNVRKTGGTNVTELAANILSARRLIQNLVVIPEKQGKKQGFGVVAGGRRLAALKQLAMEKHVPADWPIPCQIVSEHEAESMSLSENVHREDMHPADEFEAWAKLVDQGKSIEDIAANNGVGPEVVRRRLALARVSPLVLKLYRQGVLQLDQVMAFTVSDNHKAQDALLKGRSHYPYAHDIRRALVADSVPESDERVRYIGEEAYVAAGGTVRRDLFDKNNGAYFLDVTLLDQLVADKLEKTAAKARKSVPWVDVYGVELDYQIRGNYADTPTVRQEPDKATASQLAALAGKLAAAREALRAVEDAPESDDAEADEQAWIKASDKTEAIEAEIEALEESLRVPHPDAAALVGVVIGLTRDGKVRRLTNVLRASDKEKLRKSVTATIAGTAGDASPVPEQGDPQSVRTDLSTYLTAVTQEALAENIGLGLRALAYQLALRWIGESYNNHGVSVSAEDHARLPVSETLSGSAVEAQRQQRHEAWQEMLPGDSVALWEWCTVADDHTINSLLAYSAARSLAGTQFHSGDQRMAPLVSALGVKLTDHWQPEAGYFRRVKKSVTVQVLADHGYTDPALSKMKRDALAEKAADLLTGSGWLPPTLTL